MALTPKASWIKGHQLKWGNPEDPSCTWCGVRKSNVEGFCPSVIPWHLKKIGNGLGYFLFVTVWNTFAGSLVLGLLWFIFFLLSQGRANLLTATNEDMLPGVPFWVIWLCIVNVFGWITMLRDKFSD